MEFTKKIPPRIFYPTNDGEPIADHGKIFLEADEQITFVTKEGEEYDFVAKDWGFYATPSINKRITDEGFQTALVRNSGGKYYVMVEYLAKTKDQGQVSQEEAKSVEKFMREIYGSREGVLNDYFKWLSNA